MPAADPFLSVTKSHHTAAYYERPFIGDRSRSRMALDSDLTAKRILELLARPVEDRPFVQFRLRDEAPMRTWLKTTRI